MGLPRLGSAKLDALEHMSNPKLALRQALPFPASHLLSIQFFNIRTDLRSHRMGQVAPIILCAP
jgi:hypothetical protein